MSKAIKRSGGWILALAICLCAVLFSPAVYADTDGTELQVTDQPDKLVIQLGTEWAGVEFELKTDTGLYPQPLIVSEAGVLSLELGGSKTYTLSAMNSSVPAPVPAASGNNDSSEAEDGISDDGQTEAGPQTAAPDTAAQPGNPEGDGNSDETGQIQKDDHNLIRGIPNMHLFLFVGGLIACIAGLTVMWVLKRRRNNEYTDDDDDYDDDDE